MDLPGISEFTPHFFDESSRAWQENKVRCGHSYAYKCLYIHSNKKQCHKASIYKSSTNLNFCKRHFILLKSQKQFK